MEKMREELHKLIDQCEDYGAMRFIWTFVRNYLK